MVARRMNMERTISNMLPRWMNMVWTISNIGACMLGHPSDHFRHPRDQDEHPAQETAAKNALGGALWGLGY